MLLSFNGNVFPGYGEGDAFYHFGFKIYVGVYCTAQLVTLRARLLKTFFLSSYVLFYLVRIPLICPPMYLSSYT